VATQELNEKLKKVDELTITSEKRLEASRILEEESMEFNRQHNELIQQNEQLRHDVLRLRGQLKAVSYGTLGLDNPHSFTSSLQSIPPQNGKKRDRSPVA
jgi:hypothetical protein